MYREPKALLESFRLFVQLGSCHFFIKKGDGWAVRFVCAFRLRYNKEKGKMEG